MMFKLVKNKYVEWASQVAWVVKNPPGNAEDISDVGSILGLQRSPGGVGNYETGFLLYSEILTR